MTTKAIHRLTRGEMQLLEMLWRTGPVTIAEAHQALAAPIGYSTMQTRLNRLAAKGLARKTNETPTHYVAAIQPRDVMETELRALVKGVSRGVVPLVAQLFREHQPSADELDEIRNLIRQAQARLPKGPRR
jgi:predicted transcriptional regulator